MLTSRIVTKPHSTLLRLIAVVIAVLGFANPLLSFAQTDTTTPTTIVVSDTPKLTTAKRLGLVLGRQDFYDSGIFTRNLSLRNPGFEGEIWQTILHCQYVTANSCTDDNTYTYWPANFLQNASAEFIVGSIVGTTTTVTSSAVATPGTIGTVVQFSSAVNPQAGDYLVVRMHVPGNAQAGWNPGGTSGAVFSTEFSDLSPNTPGKQALRVTMGASDQAVVATYLDSVYGHSFLQFKGNLTLTFRAKSTGGSNQLAISMGRIVESGSTQVSYLNQVTPLTTGWQDYSITFPANDTGILGSIYLKFTMTGGSMLLDDVALTQPAASDNPTAYRNEVVNTLRALKPGILRFMDSGTDWGSTIDNMLAPDFARERAGYANNVSEADDIPLDLHDYLVLCQAIGAEPWYTMPTGMSTQEMSNLMDYMGGSTSTVYGAKRAALGQTAPWTSVFTKIHLEFGNEVWNTSNTGATMTDPTSYGKRAGVVFATAKASPSYSSDKFDLILDGWEAVTDWTTKALAASSNYDTVDVAAYIFNNFNDASSTENIYGPMFAEPEAYNSTPTGIMTQNATVAATAARPAKLSIYETNMGTSYGSVSQAAVNSAVPSAGAGLAVADNMLLMLRDLGITDQNMFALPGFAVGFGASAGSTATTSPLWGTVVDMGGLTNLQRPMFLSEELANSAILPTLWSTTQTGSNPTWNQPLTTNDNFSLTGAHYLQSFAFTDGVTENIILFNLSRTSALPVNFSGLNAPLGAATIKTLSSPAIDSSNESQSTVAITSTSATLSSGTKLQLAPYSMTVVSVAAPVVPILVSGVTVSCPQAALSVNQTLACSSNVAGQGKYNSGVNWSVDNGTISSTGVYSAPATLPAAGKAIITATSMGDATKSGSFSLSLAPDTITGVTVSCNQSTVGQGQVMNCSAVVKGTGGFSPAYSWASSGGSIDGNGNLTAPSTGTSVTVTATSTQDSSKSSSVTIPVFPVILISNPKGSVTSTTATISWTLNVPAHSGFSYGLTQSLGGTTPFDGTLITNPSYTVTGLTPATTYYFALFSFVNGQTSSASFSVTTSANGSSVSSVAVACSATTLSAGGTTTCTPTVKGTGSYSSAVNWTTSAGSITPAGILTAPTTGTSVVVTATSVQDATKSASAQLSVTPSTTITSIAANCPSANLTAGGTTACTATVTGTGSYSSAVTWSTSAGSITSAGELTAPTTGTSVVVTATSVQDKTKTASVNVAVAAANSITSVAVSCATSSLAVSGTTTCSAPVQGTGSYSSAVTWSASAGSITPTGVLTAPSTGTAVTVTATSTQDPTKSGSATISISAAATIAHVLVSCQASSLVPSGTTNCASSVTGTGNFSSAVTWSVSAGTISSDGVVTAPASATSVKVRATSVQNPSNSGVFVIQVTSDLAIASASVSVTSTTATISWATNVAAHNGISYGLTSALGLATPYDGNLTTTPSITLTGLLPGTNYYVIVFSFVNGQSASKAFNLTTAAATNTVSGVAISCGASTLAPLASTACSATVSGKGSYSSAVTWTASAGSVTSAGLLTAPATGTSVTIKAASVQDPTKTASQTIAISTKLQIVTTSFVASPTTIVLSWTTTQKANHGVSYGTTSSYGSTTPFDSTLTASPSITLSGLTPGTTYYVDLFSFNGSGSASHTTTVTTPTK